jgi:hypothetical protein
MVLAALGACVSSEANDPTIEKPIDGKADEMGRICELLNEPASCDACDAAGWYGDGTCDTFCALPDTDCTPTSSVADFLAEANYVTSAGQDSDYTIGEKRALYRFVMTDLTQGTANAWATEGAPMVGDGYGVHMWFATGWSTGALVPQTLEVERSVTSQGFCSSSPQTEYYVYSDAYLDVLQWHGATAERVACVLGGSVRVRSLGGTPETIELVFNVAFSDGTTWVDRTITVDRTDS